MTHSCIDTVTRSTINKLVCTHHQSDIAFISINTIYKNGITYDHSNIFLVCFTLSMGTPQIHLCRRTYQQPFNFVHFHFCIKVCTILGLHHIQFNIRKDIHKYWWCSNSQPSIALYTMLLNHSATLAHLIRSSFREITIWWSVKTTLNWFEPVRYSSQTNAIFTCEGESYSQEKFSFFLSKSKL